MSVQQVRGVVVSVYGDPTDPEFVHHVERLSEGTPFRLSSAERGDAGTARCLFVKRSEAMAVGGGNLVDLLYRLQRSFELQGAERLPAGVAG